MEIVYKSFSAGEEIPVNNFLKNRKLKKYFNRETATSIVAVGALTKGEIFDENTPFYFSYGEIEYNIVDRANDSLDENGQFQNDLFVNKSYNNVSPLTQLKYLQNMPMSFVSIEFGLRGDNAVVYNSSDSLIQCVELSPYEGRILIGACKQYFDGTVEVGFALGLRSELINIKYSPSVTAIEMFKAAAGINE